MATDRQHGPTGTPPRVLWTHNFDPGTPNAGVFMFEAARALSDYGLEPTLLYVGDLRSPVGMVAAARRIRAAAKSFDIVHAQFGSACAAVTAAAGRTARVLSIRGSDWAPAYSPSPIWQTHARLATLMTRRSLGRYDVVVSVSNRIASEVLGYRPKTNVTVLPDPIDLAKFTPMDRGAARSALGLADDGSRYVLFTAINSAASNKRRDLAEAAIAVARNQIPELKILVATGREHSEMPTVVAAADVALCTSTAEGWPNSMKEALACNVPFVATDVSDLAAIAAVEPGCFISQATPEALGASLVASLTGPRPIDLRRHLQSMTMENYAEGLISAYHRVLTTQHL